MDDEDRRAFDNLILLCLPHAEEIDLRMLVGRYPVETLRQWKIVQLQAAPSDPVVIPEDVLERAVVLSMDFRGATIDLGGKAASAPGAGGSGGGAIGPGARGGDGGHGGNHYVYTFDADQLPDKVEIEFGMPGRGGIDGLPGEAAGHMLFGGLTMLAAAARRIRTSQRRSPRPSRPRSRRLFWPTTSRLQVSAISAALAGEPTTLMSFPDPFVPDCTSWST
jgi:hypothetical protein